MALPSYANGLVYSSIANNNTILATAQGAQTVALNAFIATKTNTVVKNKSCYCGSTLGYLFLAICTGKTNTPAAPVSSTPPALNYYNIIAVQAATAADLMDGINTALNGVSPATYNNQAPIISDVDLYWDGTNINCVIYTNYLSVTGS